MRLLDYLDDESPPEDWTYLASSNVFRARRRGDSMDVDFARVRRGVREAYPRRYTYFDVPAYAFVGLVTASSPGRFMHALGAPFFRNTSAPG